MIKLFKPYVPEETIDCVSATLRSDFLAQGPRVEEFEQKFSEMFKQPYCVSVNSGTSALETAYELAGIMPGDEVITTPLTCTATNIPLLHRRAKIVWADIRPDTLCIDQYDVMKKITHRTKAVVQVHLGGQHSMIEAIPDHPHIKVISDAAQALGIFQGDYTCCSFQAIKQITTGDGGMVVCPDKKSYDKAKLLRWFGIDRDEKIRAGWQAFKERKTTFDIKVLGYKRHMNDIAATMGLVGLLHYDEMQKHRYELMKIYRDRLAGVNGITVLDEMLNRCWLCTVLVENRDDFARHLYDAGIETNVVQVRNDIYDVFGAARQDLPVMNRLEFKYISLPIGMHVSKDDVEYICDTIREGW